MGGIWPLPRAVLVPPDQDLAADAIRRLKIKYVYKELYVKVVLREHSMHKAMQEGTVATQTSVYILAQPRIVSSMTPIQYL